MEKKIISWLLTAIKVLVFFSLFYVGGVMLWLKNFQVGALILFAASFFVIFNKLDNVDRRIKELEGKENGRQM